jgi:hypothetical protein
MILSLPRPILPTRREYSGFLSRKASMRIHAVKHSLTALVCSRCRCEIKPSRDEKQTVTVKGKRVKKTVRVLGDPYKWIKFNRRPRNIRCMAPACAFMRSDLTTSEKLGRLYDAQDAAEDAIAAWSGEADDLKTILSDLASEVREVSQEYNESADNIENSFPGGSPTIDDCRDKADQLESWADEIESVDFDEWSSSDEDADSEDAANDDGQTRAEWADEQRDKASEVIGECPI